jgi:hypothetical protein
MSDLSGTLVTEPPYPDSKSSLTESQSAIIAECNSIRDFLLEKNRKYGDSALKPKRVFSKASPREQIAVRLDDKLSRLMSGQVDDTEDTKLDLIGYLILDRVAARLELGVSKPVVCKHCGVGIYQPWWGEDQIELTVWRHKGPEGHFYYNCKPGSETVAQP